MYLSFRKDALDKLFTEVSILHDQAEHQVVGQGELDVLIVGIVFIHRSSILTTSV